MLQKNKGTGAGGSNTNLYGKRFEEKTNNESNLLDLGCVKTNGYYSKALNRHKTLVFVTQYGLKSYIKKNNNIDLFRCPDEAYIIEDDRPHKKNLLIILEKKEQRTEGSVETKLWSSPSLKREYELLLGSLYRIQYGLCVNDFLKQKIISQTNKYVILNKILAENNIPILFGDDDDYFETLFSWINSSCGGLYTVE